MDCQCCYGLKFDGTCDSSIDFLKIFGDKFCVWETRDAPAPIRVARQSGDCCTDGEKDSCIISLS